MEVGYAAMDGEKDKYDNYKDLVNENYYVVPIAHETMGSWAPDSLKFLKDLGSRISEATGEKRAKSFLFQSLSMNLQRGNALCVMGTVALILVIVKSNFVKLNTVFFLLPTQTKSFWIPFTPSF